MENCSPAKRTESQDGSQKSTETVYVSSLDEDDNQTQEGCHNLCEETEIHLTIPSRSLYDRYVAKTVLSFGLKGCRPHYHSWCDFVLEQIIWLNSEYASVLEKSSIFPKEMSKSTVTIQIGSSNTELDRALEIALLDMNIGERSEIILSVSNRTKKLRDQNVLPEPYVKCIIALQSASCSCDQAARDISSLARLGSNEEEKYETALTEKNCGVELFKKQQYVDAFHRFAAGAKILMTLDSLILDGIERNKEISTLYSTLCSNMAECQLKENNPTYAITLCKRSLDHDPSNVKALYRQAVAAWTLGDVDQADSLLTKLLEKIPNNPAAKRLQKEVKERLKIYEDEFSRMMKRVFGNNK